MTHLRPIVCLASVLLLVLSLARAAAQHVVTEEPLSAADELQRFHLPPGFEMQLVASEPQIAKPINLAFDHHGRLLVTQSTEYPFPAKENPRDAVMRLSIDPQTGKAVRVEKLIDGLNIPIGVTPAADGVIVFSIPNIYYCRDTDGDGAIDRRNVLFGPFGYVDTHGLNNGFTRGLDGWFYACHGFRNTSNVRGGDGHEVSMNSGNTYRFRADGSRIEQWSHGQVNPFGLCFDPFGDMYTADCHSKPAYMLLRGACYPSFGKPHDGLGFGPELVRHSHGSTGIAGIAFYAADHFPAEYRDTLFIGNPITRRINHDVLERRGSTYMAAEQPDFLRCDDPWFRPVDIQLGPDGALYIADFYNCIIGHYEVPLDHPQRDRRRGRIWRIVYRGEKSDDPPPPIVSVADADLDELLELLAHHNLAVRTQATHELVDRLGKDADVPVRSLLAAADAPAAAKAHGLWVLHRLGALDDALIAKLGREADSLVRTHLLKAIGERSDWSEAIQSLVLAMLEDGDALVRRAAADALGRHPAKANIVPLLAAWEKAPAEDTHLIHVVRMALRDQLRAGGTLPNLDSADFARQERAEKLLDVCLGMPSPDAAAFALRLIRSGAAGEARIAERLKFVIRHIAKADLPHALAQAKTHRRADARRQFDVLLSIHSGLAERGEASPGDVQSWATALAAELLASANGQQADLGIRLADAFVLTDVYSALTEIARGEREQLQNLRADALDACLKLEPADAVALAAGILGNAAQALPLRQRAAAALGRAGTSDARNVLLDALRIAPQSLAVEIARSLAADRAGADSLLTVIASGKASANLLRERSIVDLLRRAGPEDVETRIAELTANLPPGDDRLDRLIRERLAAFASAPADVEHGQQIFAKHCAACHAVAGKGKKIGPELDGIGNRGLERLLEDVLDPNRNVDGAFRTTILVTRDGRTISGLLLREEGEVFILADGQGKEVRIGAADVEAQRRVPTSPMPANVEDILKPQEFHHLIGYLLSQRTR